MLASHLTQMEMELLQAQIEACLFVTSTPLSIERISELIGRDSAITEVILRRIQKSCQHKTRGVELVIVAQGYQFRTKSEFSYIVKLLSEIPYQELTPTQLHILAIIVYKQPINRSDIEAIRGSGVFHILSELTEIGFIEVMGKSEYEGAHLYRATSKFLEVFGLRSFAELPPLAMGSQEESSGLDFDQELAKLKAALKPIVNEPSPLKPDREMEEFDAKMLAKIKSQIAGIKTTTPYLEKRETL